MEGEFFPGNQIFQLHKIHSIEILNANDLSDMVIKEFESWKKERSFQV